MEIVLGGRGQKCVQPVGSWGSESDFITINRWTKLIFLRVGTS